MMTLEVFSTLLRQCTAIYMQHARKMEGPDLYVVYNHNRDIVPICILCGYVMGTLGEDFYHPGHSQSEITHTRREILQQLAPEWLEESNNPKDYFCGSPVDLHSIYLQHPSTWGFFYRGIYKQDATSPFQLTGVAMASRDLYGNPSTYTPNSNQHLPPDPNKMVINTSKLNNTDSLLKPKMLSLHGLSDLLWWLGHENDVPDPPLQYPFAIPMHERCWTLMTSILDENLIIQHLDTFVSANDKTHSLPKITWSSLPRTRNPQEINEDDRDMDLNTSDPLNMMDLRETLEIPRPQSNPDRRTPHKHRQKRKQKRITLKRTVRRPAIVKNHTSLTWKAPIPPEICLLILNILDKPRDIEAFIEAFPGLQMRDNFWRKMFARVYPAASGYLPPGESFKWKALCLHMDRFTTFRPGGGWWNRNRIMVTLFQTRYHFLRLVKGKKLEE